jgi:hypothetical protein
MLTIQGNAMKNYCGELLKTLWKMFKIPVASEKRNVKGL